MHLGEIWEQSCALFFLPFKDNIMDQRELETRVRQLNKTVAANEAPENALTLLNSLKKDAAPTEEMLRVSSSNEAFEGHGAQ